MQRNVYLQGELGERFGRKFIVNTENYSDIFKCIQANRPDFVPYLRKCHENDIGFILDTEENGALDHEDLLSPVAKGDITLALAPAGSKKGLTKILAAIAIIAVIYFTGGFAGLGVGGANTGYMVAASGGLTITGSMTVLFAANLALAGLQQIMAPDPAVDQDSGATTNYLFSGGANNAREGDPIPILYGELRVPGRPISIEVVQGRGTISSYATDNVYVDSSGNLSSLTNLNISVGM
jgi:predicted phage tail protein|tara:strand:- start:5322 stop:6035 length:714 start_codon:yes stop_codon:yes gene_type:complete